MCACVAARFCRARNNQSRVELTAHSLTHALITRCRYRGEGASKELMLKQKVAVAAGGAKKQKK